MKTLSILIICILFISFVPNETRNATYSNGKPKYQVDTKNGMLNGKYISWYANGQKKAEGLFKNNQRFSDWSVWDSLGQVRMSRNYINAFQYETIFVKNSKGENETMPERITYNLIRNKVGCYEYPKLTEWDVMCNKRIWQDIFPNAGNKLLFDNNRLFDIILKNIYDTSMLTAYEPTLDDFSIVLSIAEIKNKIAKDKYEVIGYKTKEDWFYNSSWQLSETRIIGICPVIKNKNNGMVTELFWLYYPELRAVLAKEKVEVKTEPLISTMEDVFHFRYFIATVYKEANIYDKKIEEYKTGNAITEEAERIQMSLIDTEHNAWIFFIDHHDKYVRP